MTIVDRNSHNGTFVNGRRLDRSTLSEGDVVGVGRHAFRLRNGVLEEYLDDGPVRIEASRLSYRTPGGETILDDVSFVLEPSSLLAVWGRPGRASPRS